MRSAAVIRASGAVRVPALPKLKHPPPPYLSQRDSIDLLRGFLERGDGNSCIITGAGVSVDSGIRAYRGKHGSYTRAGKEHRPIFFHEFQSSEKARRRYWARSFLGYPPVQVADPNPTHYAISALQTMGVVNQVITQNVDGLHHKAVDSTFATYLAPSSRIATTSSLDIPSLTPSPPSSRILELHGTLRHVECLGCGAEVGRDSFQQRLSILNPDWSNYLERLDAGSTTAERLNPDGDVELGPNVLYEEFVVPPCDSCGGPMKPKVTFFGESLSKNVRDASLAMVESASNLLVVGSSLATFSAFRLIAAYRAAKKGKGEVGLLNVGESRGDGHVDWRIGWEGGAGEVLPDAAREIMKTRGGTLDFETRDEVETLLRSGVVKAVAPGMATA